MKKMKTLCAVLLALCLLLALCACGETKAEEPASTEAPASGSAATIAKPTATEAPKAADTPKATEAPKTSAAGYYKLATISSEGKEESMAEMEAMGLIYYLVLNEDGTGVMEMLGEGTDLTWTEREISIENEPASFAFDGSSITIEADDSKMVFVRLTAEEEETYKAGGSGDIGGLLGGLTGLIGEGGETEIPEGEPSTGPVSGAIGDFDVTILGAELVEGEDDLIRFWYEFTNNSEELAGPYLELNLDAFQDGEALENGYPNESIAEDDYYYLNIAPGYTIRCTEIYEFDPDGGTVAFRVSEFWGESVVYFADPQNLSGAPADRFEFVEDGSVPDFFVDTPYTDGNVEVLDAEVIEDYEGKEAVRVYFSFTNNTEEATSFFMAYDVVAMQDGYELETSVPDEDVEEDENWHTDIAPGETIECSNTYLIRSYSPISVILKESWNWDAEYFGDVFGFD